MDSNKVWLGLALQMTGVALALGAVIIAPRARHLRHCMSPGCTAEHRTFAIAVVIACVGSLLIYIGHRLDRRY